MNNAIITTSDYENMKRMTRSDCELLCNNTSDEFNVMLHIERISASRIEWQQIKADGSVHILLRTNSYTRLYWYMVDMRELLRYSRDEMHKGNK